MIELEKHTHISGSISYYIKGTTIFHREDGPAYISWDGYGEWFRNGVTHRDGGPAYYNGECEHWYVNGELHREDGPALINDDGNIEWWFNGKRHRDDGPALIRSDGKIFWYLNNILFTKKEEWFESLTEGQKAKAIYSDYFISG
jgi:hypothetical protein